MEDIGLFRQGLKWIQSREHACSRARNAALCFRDKAGLFVEHHWPVFCSWCSRFWELVLHLLLCWRDCALRGSRSVVGFGPAALLVIMWSCFLSLTSMSCLIYVVTGIGAAGAAIQFLGFTPGLFIAGLFAILVLWMYANFWITGALFIIGGYLFSLNHARLVVLLATLYSIYSVKVRVGWPGVLLSINLAFFSNDVLSYLLHCCDNVNESSDSTEQKESESLTGDEYFGDCEFSSPCEEPEKVQPCKSSNKLPASSSIIDEKKELSTRKVVREEATSLDEMKRIMSCVDHYGALGFPRHKKIDATALRKEYRKKAMLVHPDKNRGSSLASESFKKLQCAYEILSDSTKKRDYDEQLRKEETRNRSVCQQPHRSSYQEGTAYRAEESRRIHCTKCGKSHIWVCTSRSKTKARWCQECCQYHQAKDGDGWVECRGSLVFDRPQKEIPRAFVCAEGKIFDVSEWASCQVMACHPNTHRPSFHVNMVGLERKTQRSNSSRYPWDLDAEMMDEEEEEFDLWLQQALASGLFCENPKRRRRKSWSPFKLYQLKSKKQWRRVSS